MTYSQTTKLIALLLCAALLTACPGSYPVKTVAVFDATKSVLPNEQTKGYEVFEKELPLATDDEIVVLPVTADAANQVSGLSLYVKVGARKTYDSHLKEARAQLTQGLRELREKTAAQPFLSSDYLGTARVIAEQKPAAGVAWNVVMVGDMLHDTPQLNFANCPQLASEDTARAWASELQKGHVQDFAGARVYLGQLPSTDLDKMPEQRRAAVRAFWRQYFTAAGATQVTWATDGPGQLAGFLQQPAR